MPKKIFLTTIRTFPSKNKGIQGITPIYLHFELCCVAETLLLI